MSISTEIERKFLIRMPDLDRIAAMNGCVQWEIVQTYLHDSADGGSRRVRMIKSEGKTSYVRTFKHHLSAMSQLEDECEIDRVTYDVLLREANTDLQPICKTRYRVPCGAQLLEIDIYSFWNDRATLEVELKSEDEAVSLPDWVDVIRDVTGEGAYKNRCMAASVPMEAI